MESDSDVFSDSEAPNGRYETPRPSQTAQHQGAVDITPPPSERHPTPAATLNDDDKSKSHANSSLIRESLPEADEELLSLAKSQAAEETQWLVDLDFSLSMHIRRCIVIGSVVGFLADMDFFWVSSCQTSLVIRLERTRTDPFALSVFFPFNVLRITRASLCFVFEDAMVFWRHL